MINLYENLGKFYCWNAEESKEYLIENDIEAQIMLENDFEEFQYYLRNLKTEES